IATVICSSLSLWPPSKSPLFFRSKTSSSSVASTLYMYHTTSGPNRNQESLVSKNGLGSLVGHNWEVRDGPDPNAKIIARAQSLHMNTGVDRIWQNFFCLVFEDERFKGSTFQVMELDVTKGEWAIVGGTGEFSMATGVIYKRLHKDTDEGNIVELTIHGFCPVLKGSKN
ncbi:unnamed protein product, partial [Urochloa humidicola]